MSWQLRNLVILDMYNDKVIVFLSPENIQVSQENDASWLCCTITVTISPEVDRLQGCYVSQFSYVSTPFPS